MFSTQMISENINSSVYETILIEDFLNEYICKCTISINKNTGAWTISQWYANKEYQHQGYGRMTMKELVNTLYKIQKPTSVNYIWNNVNQYVLDWLTKHFEARLSDEAIRILKYSNEDVKEGHQYILNKDLFLKYFDIE